MESYIPVFLGLLTGLLLGLTGAGGGIMASPLLVLVMHQTVTQAAPVALIAVTVGAGVGMLLGLREGIVRYRAALVLSAAGLLMTPLGIQCARMLPNAPLLVVFAILLAYLGLRYLGKHPVAPDAQPACALDPQTGRFIWNWRCARVMLGIGALAGFLSGLLGVGGGFVLVPALRQHTMLHMRSVTATSLMVLTVVSSGGWLQWLAMGHVHWGMALPFMAGMMVGMYLGRHWVHVVPEIHLRRLFGIMCLIVSIGLLVKVSLHSLG